MKNKYTLSTSNKVYLGIVLLLSILFFVILSEKTPYHMGLFSGFIVSTLLFPVICAWIAWHLSGRKRLGGSTTFNIILTLLLLGRIGQYSNNIKKSYAIQNIQQQTENFKNDVIQSKKQEQVDAAVTKLENSFKSGLESLYKSSTGSEKRYYGIMNEFTAEIQAAAQDWRDAYGATLSSRILNYALLKSNNEFEYQISVYRLYVEKSKVYQQIMDNMIQNMKDRLSELGPNSEFAKGTIEGAKEKYNLQKPFLEPLLKAHISRGEKMIIILELLLKHRDDWVYENDELIFYNEEILGHYNMLIESLGESETTINEMSQKLIEVL